jgi:hypothetical protein
VEKKLLPGDLYDMGIDSDRSCSLTIVAQNTAKMYLCVYSRNVITIDAKGAPRAAIVSEHIHYSTK